MNMSKYVYIQQGLTNKGEFIERSEWNEEFEADTDYYMSTYYYDDAAIAQYKKQNNSRKGIKSVKTDKIWFDFDDKENVENAQKDAIEVVSRLKNAGIKEKCINVFFSGNKGFEVSVKFNKMLNRTQVEHLTMEVFGKELQTLDSSLYDENQILRIPNTKHQVSGLYKVQITELELNSYKINEIKRIAETTGSVMTKEISSLNEELLKIPEKEVSIPVNLNFSTTGSKPHHWKDYKWALLNAHMLKPDERHASLMVIASTCKGLGYDESLTSAMCLSFDEKFCKSTGKPPVEDLDNVLSSVFSPDWNGGQYNFKNNKWLQGYCERISIKVSTATDELTVEIDDVFALFKEYATNIDSLTIKTGIPSLDKKVRMTIGMLVGIVAAPGVGKTSVAIQMLNTMSKKSEQCIFFSYDMYHSLVMQKLVQKHFKHQPEYIFEQFQKGNKEYEEQIRNKLKDEYKNVEFCFDAGQTVDDIERTIRHTKEKTNKDARLVVIDYNELIVTNFSDPTQSSSYAIQKLRELANKYNCCILVLLQPNKLAGTPADELKSYRAAKGSSAIEQAMSVMLGLSRPGYNPRNPEDDKFMVINGLKNRMGSIFSISLGFDGLTGTVSELTTEERTRLREIEEAKIIAKEENGDNW
jgi:KaiC/GvpD/RAD55 family RecA-like ATPase